MSEQEHDAHAAHVARAGEEHSAASAQEAERYARELDSLNADHEARMRAISDAYTDDLAKAPPAP